MPSTVLSSWAILEELIENALDELETPPQIDNDNPSAEENKKELAEKIEKEKEKEDLQQRDGSDEEIETIENEEKQIIVEISSILT